MALRDAGIECYNLSGVSSVVPPEAEIIDSGECRSDLGDNLDAGQVVNCVLSKKSTANAKPISCSVAAVRGEKGHGYLIESQGRELQSVKNKALSTAVDLLHSEAVEERYVAERAIGNEDFCTTVVSVALLIDKKLR